MITKVQRFLKSIQVGQKMDLGLLFALADYKKSLSDRALWVRHLIEWVRHRQEGTTSTATRVKFLLQFVERHPDWKHESAAVIRSVLRESKATRLYTEVGLPNHATMMSEFFSRLGRILIPHYDDPGKASHLLGSWFYELEDVDWIREISPDQWREILAWLRTDLPGSESLIPGWEQEVLGALRILLNRSSAILLREDVCDRAPEFQLDQHPLLLAEQALMQLAASPSVLPQSREAWLEQIAQGLRGGQDVILAVRRHLETAGVSVDLVYQMERVRSDLQRARRLLAFLRARFATPELLADEFSLLAIELLRGLRQDEDLGILFKKQMGILARKVVERTGETGEHYTIQNWPEYKKMLLAGLGGGIITAGTAFIKYAVNTHGWPLFLEFVYISLNYSGSFLIMHVLGFKLATKQPSATASHLAARLKQGGDAQEIEPFTNEVRRIGRSQFAALVGNVAGAIPSALFLGWIFVHVTGHAFLNEEQAEHVVLNLHPLLSGTLLYASFTGVLLFLSSLIAGWAENASAFYQIPRLLEWHPFLRWWLGAHRTKIISQKFASHVAGVTGAVSFGVLLGLFPLFGRFFGLPFDIRHVTLSSGISAAAFQTLGLDSPLLFPTICGVLLIGFLNFTVSFTLALIVALRAREVSLRMSAQLFSAVGKKFLQNPLTFVMPKKDEAPVTKPH